MSLAPYSVALNAASGMWEYRPLRDALATDGWNASYTGSTSWPSTGTTEDGVGSLFLRTQLSGASVGITFFGTSLHLCLTDNGTRYLTFLDGASVEPTVVTDESQCVSQGATTTLALTDLEFKSHTVRLSIQNPTATSQFQFFGGSIGTNIDINGADDIVGEKSIDDLDPGWALFRKSGTGGGWDTAADERSYLGSSSFTCYYDERPDGTATYNFTGASAIVLYGSTSINNHAYSVIIDGETFNSDISASSWHIPSIVTFFRAGLDPGISHTITFRNWSDDDTQCPHVVASGMCCQGFDRLMLIGSSKTLAVAPSASSTNISTSTTTGASISTTPSSAQPSGEVSSSTNIAPVVGGVVGGFVAALLITGVVICICRRKRQRNSPQWMNSITASHSSLTPYLPMLQTGSLSKTPDLSTDGRSSTVHPISHPRLAAPPAQSRVYFAASSHATTSTTNDPYESEVPLNIGTPAHPLKARRPPGLLFPPGESNESSSSGKGSSSEIQRTPDPAQVLESQRQDVIDMLVAQVAMLQQRDAILTTNGTLPPAYRQSPI